MGIEEILAMLMGNGGGSSSAAGSSGGIMSGAGATSRGGIDGGSSNSAQATAPGDVPQLSSDAFGNAGKIATAGINSAISLYNYFSDKWDLQNAKNEAQNIDARNFAAQQEQNRFSEKMQTQQLQGQQQQQAFNQKQTTAVNLSGITKDMIAQINSQVGQADASKNNTIARWAA